MSAERSVHVTTFSVLFAISFCHLLNDMMQSLLAAIYPQLKIALQLNFVQVGLITATYQFTASMLQPLVGLYADRQAAALFIAGGHGFHADRVAPAFGQPHLSIAARPPRRWLDLDPRPSTRNPLAWRAWPPADDYGLAQSLFQVGGNFGQALGPVGAAAIVLSFGQKSIAWFALMALLSIMILSYVGLWYKRHGIARMKAGAKLMSPHGLSRNQVVGAILILLALIFSKQIYFSGIQTYYTFYLIHHFGVSLRSAQLISVAVPDSCGGRNACRRTDWRPHRPKIRNLVFGPGRAAFFADAAIYESVLDGRAVCVHRTDSVVVLSRRLWSMRRNLCPAKWAPFRDCFSVLPSVSREWVRPRSAGSPTRPA